MTKLFAATLLASFATVSFLACNEGHPPGPRLGDPQEPRGVLLEAPPESSADALLFGPRVGTPSTATTSEPSATAATPPTAAPTASATSSASAQSDAEWSTLTDVSTLLGGEWSVFEPTPNGALPARVVFVEDKKGSKTPYNLRFTSASLADGGGGCGFYAEVHDDSWRTGFCQGFGLRGETGTKTKLILERSRGGQRIQIKIGSFVDAVLWRG